MGTVGELPPLAASTQDDNRERREKTQDGSIVFKIALSNETKDQPEHPTDCSKPDQLSRFLRASVDYLSGSRIPMRKVPPR